MFTALAIGTLALTSVPLLPLLILLIIAFFVIRSLFRSLGGTANGIVAGIQTLTANIEAATERKLECLPPDQLAAHLARADKAAKQGKLERKVMLVGAVAILLPVVLWTSL